MGIKRPQVDKAKMAHRDLGFRVDPSKFNRNPPKPVFTKRMDKWNAN